LGLGRAKTASLLSDSRATKLRRFCQSRDTKTQERFLTVRASSLTPSIKVACGFASPRSRVETALHGLDAQAIFNVDGDCCLLLRINRDFSTGSLMRMAATRHRVDWGLVVGRVTGVVVLLAGILLAARLCMASPVDNPVSSIFDPRSTPAESIRHLSFFVLSITGLIFLVVFTLLVYAILKFRGKSGDRGREPAQVYGSTQIELAWTVIPILIVAVLFAATARVIHAIQDAPRPAGVVEVTAIGHQFWWEFRYPGSLVVTANELHIPVSDPSHPTPTFLKLFSADTDHSFWIPQLAGKTDLIPNHPNETWLDPHETGLFLGQCAQYCGTQHAKMLLSVYVDSSEDFKSWVERQQQPAIEDEKEAAGRRVFERTACLNCHAINGTNGNGRFGPDLTHLMSRRTIASGAAENNAQNLRLWIQNPDAIKPGSLMPAMKLSDNELDALVRYLETLQ